MSDFLLELKSEEIPARMQAGARADLERLFRKEMEAAGVAVDEITVWSTPRRLALVSYNLPDATQAISEELKGPKTGAPPQALEGFLRKTGLKKNQLTERDGVYFAVSERPGKTVKNALAEAIPAIIRAFPWPKSMRWGEASLSTESLRWVRPLSGIVAIFGGELVECEVSGVRSGYATKGHRFHHPGEITIGGVDDYIEKLRACHVIVDHEERQDIIRAGAAKAVAEAGLVLVEDEGLVIENAGLTEWPVPLLGRFDPEFLEVPPEVIQLTALANQKYFVCTNPPRALLGEGDRSPKASGGGAPPSAAGAAATSPSKLGEDLRLANAFVCTANIVAADGGAAIIEGNRKVLAARLSDARFFWDQDRRKTLEQHAEKLKDIVFHEKLGTVADKVERVAKLARWLVEEGIVKSSPERGGGPAAKQTVEGGPSVTSPDGDAPPPRAGEDLDLADLAEQAARLCKADLVTEMVGEFPELQGVMGGYYARAEGLPDAVADAIRDHYKPVGQGDEVPTAPVTVAVSLADKLDSLVGFFAADMLPTGSKDPFALRRAELGRESLTYMNDLRYSLADAIMATLDFLAPTDEDGERWIWGHKDLGDEERQKFDPDGRGITWSPQTQVDEQRTLSTLRSFFADRLKVQQREAGVRHDLIDAVFALGGEDDLVRLLARVQALQNFIATEDGANLLVAYKRAANILKKEAWDTPSPLQGRGRSREAAEGVGSSPTARADRPHPNPSPEGGQNSLSYTPEKAEAALIAALDKAGPKAAKAVESEDFEGAMAALASLRAPIDKFFDEVTVNDENSDKRAARLDLLARFRAAVHKVADFSKIEG